MLLALLAGCASTTRQLMPAPNLYSGPEAPPLFSDLPAELQGNELDLLYVTDRAPETTGSGELRYGYERSLSAAFGSAIVSIEPAMSWAELERASLQKKRETKLTLELTTVKELGRFGETPAPVVLIDGEPQLDPAVLEASSAAQQTFHQEVRRRLAVSPTKEVVMFVHGFNNDFDDAAFTLAELWHYLGREHVPILYTWPAGRGGPSGYIYDRESGEFTVHHLKRLIRDLSTMPEIRTFHLIAHSRGTDVLSSAVRELALVARAREIELPDEFRDSHIILAAPDLDMDVVSQRIVAEQLGRESKNITIYTSESDKALGLAEPLLRVIEGVVVGAAARGDLASKHDQRHHQRAEYKSDCQLNEHPRS